MKKIISLLLAVAMMLSLAACGGNGSSDANLIETDLSKPVTIKWIMPGPGIQADSEMVWADSRVLKYGYIVICGC